jgi:transposase-like protein
MENVKTTKVDDKDRRYKITEEEKQRAIAMRQSGMTLKSIANELGYSLTTIDNVVNPEKRERRNALIRGYNRVGNRYKDIERREEYKRKYNREYHLKRKQQMLKQ